MIDPLKSSIYKPGNTSVVSSQQYKPSFNDPNMWLDSAKFFRALSIPILKSLMRTFTVAAAKYTPPGDKGKKLGVTTIPHQKYFCLIIDLEEQLKNPPKKLSKDILRIDKIQFEKGYKFKIIRNKFNEKPQFLGFAKNIRYAKHMARIENRGLFKYSWGTLLNTFNKQMIDQSHKYNQFTKDDVALYRTEYPPVFRTLAKKSPSIKKWSWGVIKGTPLDMQNAKWRIDGYNNIAESFAWGQIAVKRGIEAALHSWKSMVSAIQIGAVSRLQRFMDFQIHKLDIRYNKTNKK